MVEIFAGLCLSVSVSICGAGFSVCKLFVTVGAAEITGGGKVFPVAGIEPGPETEGVPLLT